MKFLDRTGLTKNNNFGSKMTITRYKNANDIDVYFEEYNWTAKNKDMRNFNAGRIKCPYEPRLYGVGYIGEGKYKMSEGCIKTKAYNTWRAMIERCYNKNKHDRPTYDECTVCNEWHNFQNFAEWHEENYYEIDNEKMCLDKDIMIKNNKIYSPETCIFVPNRINVLFTKRQNKRGKTFIGLSMYGKDKKFRVSCQNENCKHINLGSYNTQEEAFAVYKQFKENVIKQVADEYKDLIPEKLYNAMYEYEVEIED